MVTDTFEFQIKFFSLVVLKIMKTISLKSGLSSILFWSIISAAFIGPGTVTTAASAGALFKYDLLWALTFATIATIFLQEAAARISVVSGYSLGQAISKRYSGSRLGLVKLFIVSAILLGGAAYQAGNILGAVSGLTLITPFSNKLLSAIIVLLAGMFLWSGNTRFIANTLGVVVALMGLIFIIVAMYSDLSFGLAMKSAVIPSIPVGSDLLIIGLIGTTIVPYNLFLAAGISKGQKIQVMRLGIVIAVIIGGIISMAILLVGMQVNGEFSFVTLSQTLQNKLGPFTGILFGIGLFAAGFTSSITAPLASALTVQSVYGDRFSLKTTSSNFKIIWALILFVGFLFGISDVKPIPVIILAQAFNGLLLPFITILILFIVNDKSILTSDYVNKKWSNLVLIIICGITTFLKV